MSQLDQYDVKATPIATDRVLLVDRADTENPTTKLANLSTLKSALALGTTDSPTFAGLTVSGAASLGAQIAWDDGETRKGSVNLDAIDSTTWVTAIAGFGGQAGALIAGRMAGGVTTVILAQEGTTGISTGHEVSDGTALQFQVVGTDLQVRAAATGSESATVNVSAIKLG